MNSIIFNNVEYVLMKSGYYLSKYNTNHERRTKTKSLHVAIYEFYSGNKVKNGFVIHHIDNNKSNNSFENLACISRSDHSKMHPNNKLKTEENSKKFGTFSLEMWKNRSKITKICKNCQKEYLAYWDRSSFCSEKCYNRHYYITKTKAP